MPIIGLIILTATIGDVANTWVRHASGAFSLKYATEECAYMRDHLELHVSQADCVASLAAKSDNWVELEENAHAKKVSK